MRRKTGGRPTLEEAHRLSDRIIDAAARLMLDQGYGVTSIEAIAREAGVAKRTLYHRFPDKRSLLAAVLEGRRERFLSPVAKIADSGELIDAQLKSVARHMLEWALRPDTIALNRLLTSEAARIPDLVAEAYDSGWARVIEAVAKILESAIAKGVLNISDSLFAAEQFVEMVLGPGQRRAAHGLPPRTDRATQGAIEGIVALFLDGCRTHSAGRA